MQFVRDIEARTLGTRNRRSQTLTIRQRIVQMLGERELTARDLSRKLGLSEKEVYSHLPHVARSLGPGVTIISEPAYCRDCGFVFKDRERFTTPGRCPRCRSEAIVPPVYGVRPLKGKGPPRHTEHEEDI